MLELPKDELCFKCHGPGRQGAAGRAQTDIYGVTLKRSNHPVLQTSRYHVPGEQLPELSEATQRHVSCYDCHNAHLLSKSEPLKGVRGYYGRGAGVKEAQKEYQVCYLCHSDSANIPRVQSNVAEKFDPSNASYHPVQAAGKSRSVPSLKPGLFIASVIKCSDCHGNDDKTGPKGPHGSNFPPILKASYTRESGSESLWAYELCYTCHERNSILGDQSFRGHKRHVLYANLPCASCHDAHGSRDNDSLIYFDPRSVFPNSAGQLRYVRMMPGKSTCLLNCHVGAIRADHRMAGVEYCVNKTCTPVW